MHKTNFVLSSVMGVFFGLVSAVIMVFVDRSKLYIAVMAGVLFAVLLFLFLTVYMARSGRTYGKMEDEIGSVILLREDGVMQIRGKALYVRMCFCENSLFLLSMEVKPPMRQEIPYTEIAKWEQVSPGAVVLHRTDGTSIRFQVAAEEFLRSLEEADLR